MPREPRCACKEMDARREAPGVASTTRKTRNDTDIPSRRNPLGPLFHSIPSLVSTAARWGAQTDSLHEVAAGDRLPDLISSLNNS